MQVIIFNKDEEPVGDYEIEDTYQMFKNNIRVYMSNFLLLQRFILGVREGDIPRFTLTVTDLDGISITEICGPKGELYKSLETEILGMSLNLFIKLSQGLTDGK